MAMHAEFRGCVANGTAMLCTSRGRFAEYDVLVAEMPRYLRCRFIDGDDLRRVAGARRWTAFWPLPRRRKRLASTAAVSSQR